jgi:hypothetical protein
MMELDAAEKMHVATLLGQAILDTQDAINYKEDPNTLADLELRLQELRSAFTKLTKLAPPLQYDYVIEGRAVGQNGFLLKLREGSRVVKSEVFESQNDHQAHTDSQVWKTADKVGQLWVSTNRQKWLRMLKSLRLTGQLQRFDVPGIFT